ncbi:MAG: glycoside hydrolase family 32 protein [Lachnospiraceae bacterium]|nr:glycoside hydrolase family 32 protein [Lachnospiraceae bacterium]
MNDQNKTAEYQAKIKEAEKNISSVQQSPYALKLHMMPPVGWLNDPNGLCQKDGIYHIFFQYSPFDARGGEKFWGHMQTPDFIHYEYTGAPLAPDLPIDRNGVYSGSALVEDGIIKLYYTGNVKEKGSEGIMEGRDANTIYVETKDGINMSSKKLLMTNEDYPDFVTRHVRDPKIWKEDDTYYMVQGAWSKDYKGHVLIFTSKNGINWNYSHALTTAETFGYMWECPTIFPLADSHFLSISPQGLAHEEFRYQNIYQAGYFQIDGDFKGKYELNNFQEWDMGFDFYAPQIFEDEKGRQILIGWMGIPDADYSNPTIEDSWQHTLTLPRELTLSADGKQILQRPVSELEKLRKEQILPDEHPSGEIIYKDLSIYELLLNNVSSSLSITIAKDLHLDWNEETGVFSLSFTGKAGYGRTERKTKLEKLEDLQMFVDTSAIEVYLNKGAVVFASRFYPMENNHDLLIQCNDCIRKLWELSPIKTTYHNQ